MAQRMSLEATLAEIAELERRPASPETRRLLEARLRDSSNIAVARAAEAMGAIGDDSVIPALVKAFTALLRQPAAADKNCHAKEAMIAALVRLDSPDPDPYLLGIRHVQMEPVYGGRVDTAANLRGHCAEALARMRYREAHFAILPLLADREPPARRMAIRALAHLGDERSELLLRMKALTGDTDPAMLGECFSGLLAMEPERSVPFVGEYLRSDLVEVVEQAALALGGSRRDDAFAILRACWEGNSDFALRRALLLSIALVRSEESFHYLLQQMRDEGGTVAALACEALAIYRDDSRRRDEIADTVAALGDASARNAYREHF